MSRVCVLRHVQPVKLRNAPPHPNFSRQLEYERRASTICHELRIHADLQRSCAPAIRQPSGRRVVDRNPDQSQAGLLSPPACDWSGFLSTPAQSAGTTARDRRSVALAEGRKSAEIRVDPRFVNYPATLQRLRTTARRPPIWRARRASERSAEIRVDRDS